MRKLVKLSKGLERAVAEGIISQGTYKVLLEKYQEMWENGEL